MNIGLIISLAMTLYLFSFTYIEALRISNHEGKVDGGTFIFTFIMAFLFSSLTYLFI